MMSPQVAAGLTAFVGVCMVAGWLSAFRNRAYLGWLGLAFLALSGSLLAHDRARQAQVLGVASPQVSLLAKILLLVCLLSFVLALVAAVRETARRLRDIRDRHRAAEEALLAMMQARREKEDEAGSEERGSGDSSEGDGP